MEKISVNSDATITLQIDGTFTAEEAKELLQRIGNARAQVANDPTNPQGLRVEVTPNPAWYTEPVVINGTTGAALYLRNPGFGWLSFVLPIADGAALAGALGTQVAQALKSIQISVPASSVAPVPNTVQ